MSDTPPIFTIGHSTHSADEFVGLLTMHGVRLLADVRRFPGSRRYPHFNREALAEALAAVDVSYRWFPELGGRRAAIKSAGDDNAGLRNASFRNYADYMQTPEFHSAASELQGAAAETPTAIMCSEALYWRCHRRLIGDYLLAQGTPVMHIMSDGKLQPHAPTTGARMSDGTVTYPGPESRTPLFD